MAPSSDETPIFPSTSSPTPVRDTQPQYNSPTTTARGTQRGHAELDTPPPGTQPPDLRRSDRTRGLSSRGADSAKHTKKALAGHSHVPVPGLDQPTTQAEPQAEPGPAPGPGPGRNPACRPNSSQQPGKRKRATLKFDGETTEEEEPPTGVRLRQPRKRRTKAHSPPPKPPCRRLAAARPSQPARSSQSARQNQPAEPSQPARRGFRLNAEAAETVVDLLGVDPATATTRTINERLLSLSDHSSAQVDSEGRYTKIRGEAPVPLSPLSKKRGGYHRDTLLALGHPTPSNTKRPPPDVAPGSSKRARFDESLNYSVTSNPAFRGDMLSLPSFTQSQPATASSTQRAVVGAFASQPESSRPSRTSRDHVGFKAGLTPIPEPRDIYSQRNAQRNARPAASPAPRAPVPETRASSPDSRAQPYRPRAPSPARPTQPPQLSAPIEDYAPPRQPIVLVPGTPSRSPTPVQRPAKPPPTKPPPPTKQPRSDTRKRRPNNKSGTTTESESESEPVLEPKPKARARDFVVGRSHGRSSQAVAGPSTLHRHRSPPRPRASPVPPTRHRDAQAVLDRLGDILNGGGSDDDSDDATVNRVIEMLMQRRQRSQPSSSRNEPSSSRHTHSSSRRHALDHDDDEPTRPSRKKARNVDQRATCGDSGSDSPVDYSKNGLGRYPGRRGKVASHAIPHLLAVAIRKGVYQDKSIYRYWAKREYIRAWKKLYPRVKYEPPPKLILRLMVLRISGLRTDVKKRVRTLVTHLHGLRNPGSSERRLERNRQLCRRLLPNAFHCLNLNADEDYYTHQHLFDAIAEALFSHPDSPAILHHHEFRLIPLPAVAFVLTMMQDSLQEWDTGSQRVRDNHFRQQRAIFDAHLHGLHVYRGKARGRLTDLQSDWFLAGMQHAGIRVVEGSDDEQESDHDFCQAVTQACFIKADSGSESEPEPEPEPEYNVHGCMTAKSKGKGKAKAENYTDDDDDGTPTDDLGDDDDDE
ncbi:hypothetical protein FRC12_006266 [Ceratobasidium sp. 428]|nr:hypothetical protein FRC12_006266 [Ceratobasidium sp. 428]